MSLLTCSSESLDSIVSADLKAVRCPRDPLATVFFDAPASFEPSASFVFFFEARYCRDCSINASVSESVVLPLRLLKAFVQRPRCWGVIASISRSLGKEVLASSSS